MNRSIRTGAALACAFTAVACSVDVASPKESVGDSEQRSIIVRTNGWSSNVIPVCWTNPSAADTVQRSTIQRVITNEYGSKTRINFIGWGTCDGTTPALAIRIQISDVGPNSRVGATSFNPSMVLNTTYVAFDKGATARMPYDAIHEFGHAVGLFHEQDRADSPCRSEPVDEGSGARLFGPYDATSIMNYCADYARAKTLSYGDVLSLKALFGAPGQYYAAGAPVYRSFAGKRCHVVSPEQLDAFGGSRLLGGSANANDVDVGECTWPDGFYRTSGTAPVYFATHGDDASSQLCWVESPTQLDTMGGPDVVMDVTGYDHFRGRSYTGRCAWSDGYYRKQSEAAVYRIDGDNYCHVDNQEDMNLLGGFNLVHVVPDDASIVSARQYAGECPPVGKFDVTNTPITSVAGWAAEPGVKVLSGDFNNDGLSDVALVGGAGWNTMPVAYSNGDGSFRVENRVIGDFAAWAAAPGVKAVTGDFDRNGVSDVALVGGPGWNTMPIAFGNGDGTFRVTNSYIGDFTGWGAGGSVTMLAGDFDRDGKDDVALTGGAGWTTLPVAFSNGDGTFRVVNRGIDSFAGWAAAAGVKAVSGDFNKDSFADVALTGGAGWKTLPVAFGKGDGTFTITNTPLADFAAWAQTPGVKVVAGDFNADGRVDVAMTGGAGWTTLPIAFSNGDGSFNVENGLIPYVRSWSQEASVQAVAGLFNRDARADIALSGGVGWATLPVAFRSNR